MFNTTFGSGGFGGQQQQGTGFGSGQGTFGSTGSFGAPASGFGAAANTGGFGGAAQSTGFGATPAGNAFGAAPASTGFGGGGFGASSTGFGVQAQTQPQSGFGGSSFGGANTATSTGGFGAGFGAAPGGTSGFGSGTGFGAKPATTGFGAQPTSGFGAAANTGFGAAAATNTFGGGGGMLGGGMNAAGGTGTVNPAFAPFVEKDQTTGQNSHYQSITAMPAYRNYSFEELRLQDYQQGRKFPGQGTGFGAAGGFGQQPQQQQPAATGFGQTSTGFGANTTSTLGGFGSGSTGFGGAATTGFGSSSAFGSTAPATNAFGAQATAPATGFGATTSAFGAQPSTGFGSTTGATGFGATGFGATAAKPATGFGGFGATATSQPATGFGAATTGGFGGATTTPSLFGGAGAGTTSAFGAPTATSAPGFGGFGAAQTSTAPVSTGLSFGLGGSTAFGAAKPATTSLFGNTATSAPAAPAFGAFGTTPAAGTGGLFGGTSTGSSLFPATSTASAGLFGGAGATAAPAFGASTTSTGLFGASKPATTGGLFSQTPGMGFGTTPAFGAAGATQAPSLFGGAGATGSTFGTSTLGGGLFGSSTNMAAAQPAMVASVNGNIYGDNPLFQRDNAAPATKPQPAVLSRPEPAQKLPALIPPVRFSPRHSQIRLRPTSTATFSSSVAGNEAAPGRKSLLLLDGINDDSAFSSDDYTPRRSVKKLDLKPRGHGEDHLGPQGAQYSDIMFNPSLETAASESLSKSRPAQDRPSTSGTQTFALSRHETPSSTVLASKKPERPEGEYWMEPPLEKLREMSRAQLQRVEGFKVGLPEYGSVEFLQPVDLTTVPSLSAICGHLVVFDKKVCRVYPDEHNKPPRGQGLNVPALISLEQCWPLDRTSREPIKFDKSSPMYAQHMKRLRRQADTTFVDFTIENGTWTFRVEHFSEYGLTDDDEDDHTAQTATNTAQDHGLQPAVPMVNTMNQGYGIMKISDDDQRETDGDYASSQGASSSRDSRSTGQLNHRARPTSRLTKQSDPQRVNMMRASLFGDSQSNQDRLPKRTSVWSTSSEYSEKAENAAEHSDGFGAEIRRPSFQEQLDTETSPLTRPPRKVTRSLYEQSLLSRKGALLADAGLMMGRSCRVGWGPNGQLALCGTLCGFESVKDRSERANDQKNPEVSATSVQLVKVRVVAAEEEVEMQRSIVSLQALLQYTTIALDGSNRPEASIVPRTSFTTLMNSLKERQHHLSNEEVYAWILGQSLFDVQPAPDNISEMSKEAQESYEVIGRRVRCSNWLSHVTKPLLEADLRRIEAEEGSSAEEEIFTLLVSNKRQKACVTAVESRDLRLATLISQSGRGSKPLAGIEDQLALYKSAGSVIPPNYLKAFALLSGALTVDVAAKGEPRRFVTDGLDWRRTFGLYLWYSNKPGADLREAIEQYVFSMRNKTVARPRPWYASIGNQALEPEQDHNDFLFELLTLFIEPSKGLETVLHPLGMTPANLDYRQSWVFYMILAQSLRISGFRSSTGHAKICENYIFQLESLGLWEWAVFVALHLESAISREITIRQLLERNVDLPAPSSIMSVGSAIAALDHWTEESEKNTFIIGTLKVPGAWVWSARATRAKYNGDLPLEVFSLLKAGEHHQGHVLIVTKLAPELILRGELQTLGNLLGMVDQSKVSDWNKGGSLYQKYLECCSDFEGRFGRLSLRSKSRVSYASDLIPEQDIQALQSEVQELLTQLPLLLEHKTTESSLLEVCVSEVASRCTDLLRDLKDLSIQQGPSLTDLPLTEEQRMNALQKISGDYFDEILSFAEASAY
ncbi:hypothetical protein BGX28_007343 [Mortierella sp. GBA30]|nr:hypothetical protein BGX28_007343 [Mortierella sp. GBA30]